MTAYDLLFRGVLSRLDAERAHHLAALVIRGLGVLPSRTPGGLEVETLGLRFPTPFGVAAGFDKGGRMIAGLGALGFGHVEVGTITAIPQPGNEKPRLFRLTKDRALINRMGFNNVGAVVAAQRIAKARRRRIRPIIGINIGKSRVVEVDDAAEDYRASTRLLAPLADYLVVNVSSPNTPGLRGLQELDRLEPLLRVVLEEAGRVPVLVKIAPDLTDEQAVRIAELAVRIGLAGIVATNTTLSREGLATDPAVVEAAGAGGVSGPPVAARSLELLRLLRAAVPEQFCVISAGGVDTPADVRQRLAAGATLVQGYTAFLYRGPGWARQINKELALGA